MRNVFWRDMFDGWTSDVVRVVFCAASQKRVVEKETAHCIIMGMVRMTSNHKFRRRFAPDFYPFKSKQPPPIP